MTRLFWILISIEMALLLLMFVSGLTSPSHSGGREMGLFFGVVLPMAVLVGAAGLYGFSNSAIARKMAMAIALAPLFGIGYVRSRSFLIERQISSGSVGAFHGPGQQALAQAIDRENIARVEELAGRTKLNEPSAEDLTLLSLALRGNTPATAAMVRALLRAGADPNVASEKGWSVPLMRAISSRQTEVIAALLEHAADPNRTDTYGSIAFQITLTSSDDVSLKLLVQLLDRGAKVDLADGQQQTALMVAAIHGNAKALNILLDRGADRKLVDKDGKTALDHLERRMSEPGPQPDLPALQTVAARLRTKG